MDDKLYDIIMSYARQELIPRFKQEFKECNILKECPIYTEIKAFCKAMNTIAPYTKLI